MRQSRGDRNSNALAATSAAATNDTIVRPTKTGQRPATFPTNAGSAARTWTPSASATGAIARPKNATPAANSASTAAADAMPTTAASSAEGPRRKGWGSRTNAVMRTPGYGAAATGSASGAARPAAIVIRPRSSWPSDPGQPLSSD